MIDNVEHYLESLVRYAGDVIFTVGSEKCILSWNIGAEEILGYPRDEIIGKSVNVLSSPNEPGQMSELTEEVLTGGGDVMKNLDLHLRAKNGDLVDVYVTASPIMDEKKNVRGVSVIAKDVTDQNRLIYELVKKEKNDARIEALKETLSTISHHINNATASIVTMAELCKRMPDEKNVTILIDLVMLKSRTIAAVIRSLNKVVERMDFRTIEYGGAPTFLLDIEEEMKRIIESEKD